MKLTAPGLLVPEPAIKGTSWHYKPEGLNYTHAAVCPRVARLLGLDAGLAGYRVSFNDTHEEGAILLVSVLVRGRPGPWDFVQVWKDGVLKNHEDATSRFLEKCLRAFTSESRATQVWVLLTPVPA